MASLNIGAGSTYIPGFVNIDIAPYADISMDIGRQKLPFDDGSVDIVFSYHTLEHIPDYLFALGEIHRVLKHGALFLVGVPYVTLSYYNQVNPYHLHNFNESSFDFFEPGKLLDSAAEWSSSPRRIMFTKVFHRFHYMGVFRHLPAALQDICRRHLWNTVEKIDFGLLALKGGDGPACVDAAQLMTQFDQLLQARRAYDPSVKERFAAP